MKNVAELTKEIRDIARYAPMSVGTRTRLHAIARNIERTVRNVLLDAEESNILTFSAACDLADDLGLPITDQHG